MQLQLPEWLELEALDRDLFRGTTPEQLRIRGSLYGGQVAAQALRAAGATVTADRGPHSFHGYFLRRGVPERPVLLHVDRDRDGGSFSARHVRAVQDGEVIFSMLASFHVPADNPTYDGVLQRDDAARPRSGCWVRIRDLALPDDPLLHACALTYVSDLGSGFPGVDVPGLAKAGPSVDHSLWFHEFVRADGWLSLEMWPTKAISTRGVYHGSLRAADGQLGAVFAQEMLLRNPDFDDTSLVRIARVLGVEATTDRPQ